MLALGQIFEKGLVNENMQNGGIYSMGAVGKSCSEANNEKAFQYYDLAGETQAYALYKLGEFMENGMYGHGYRGKAKPELAFAFYKASCRRENGCREALFKMGEFYQKGLDVEKNVAAAIRKYDES